MLVVVCGPPGTGKTTVAEWIAQHRDARLVRTDVVRGDVVDDPEYTEAERRRVYESVFRRIEAGLEDGSSVVADGTFDRREYRERVGRVAMEADVRFELVRVTCDPETVERRIERRENDESDATVENYHEIRDEFDPVTGSHLRIDNSGTREAMERALREHFECAHCGSR
ncbi:MAG: AAA family ATPase [Halobacteriales archaeon]